MLVLIGQNREKSYQVLGYSYRGGVLLGVAEKLHPGLDEVRGVNENPRRHAASTSYDEVRVGRQILGGGLLREQTVRGRCSVDRSAVCPRKIYRGVL